MTRHANPTLPAEILDAAERIVAAEGTGALSMRRLAGATGVTPPTLYYYFTSKDRLLTLVRLRTAKRLNGRLQRLDLTNTKAALVAVAEAYIGFAEENPRLFQLLVEQPSDAALLTREEHQTLHFPYFMAERVLDARDTAMARWFLLHGFASLLASGALEDVLGLRREELRAKFLEIYAGSAEEEAPRTARKRGRPETA